MNEVLLTVKEYAERYRCTENGVYIAIREGRFPFAVVRPLGGSIRIRIPDHAVINPSVERTAE
jgi:hypothetical protein